MKRKMKKKTFEISGVGEMVNELHTLPLLLQFVLVGVFFDRNLIDTINYEESTLLKIVAQTVV